MTDIKLDHIITFANVPRIDTYLSSYRKEGFVVGKKTVRHFPGLRNGFVYIGAEYLEFEWVENKEEYKRGKLPYHDIFVKNPAPFGIGLVVNDVRILHRAWRKRGFKITPVYSLGPRGAKENDPPWWSFQKIPPTLLPGVWSFALTYLFRSSNKKRVVRVGRNSIYAIEGITFVVSNPKSRAKKWKKLLAPRAPILDEADVCRLKIGPHIFTWITKNAYKNYYGVSYRKPYSGGFGNLREARLIHLLAVDSEKAVRSLGKSRKIKKFYDRFSKKDAVFIFPKKSDGFTFTIREMPIKKWVRERTNITKEKLRIEHK